MTGSNHYFMNIIDGADYVEIDAINSNTIKIDELLYELETNKAELVNGKIPEERLPETIGKLFYGQCTTTSSTAAKLVSINGFTLKSGVVVGVKFNNGNTAASPTLNVNGSGPKAIRYKGASPTSVMIPAGLTALLQYNGTQWELLNPAVDFSGYATETYVYDLVGSINSELDRIIGEVV